MNYNQYMRSAASQYAPQSTVGTSYPSAPRPNLPGAGYSGIPTQLGAQNYYDIVNFNQRNNRKMRAVRMADGTYALENGLRVDQSIADYLGWNDLIMATRDLTGGAAGSADSNLGSGMDSSSGQGSSPRYTIGKRIDPATGRVIYW